MSNTFGNHIKISVAGQSHSKGMGVIIDGLPAGFCIDMDALQTFLNRRAPGQNVFSTKRKEADKPEFLSGLINNCTCGAPILATIQNTDTHSSDYESFKAIPRPSHADYTAQMKYNGFQDVAGGGQFSGRLTAPLCVAGGICLQLLEQENIHILAHIKQIHSQKVPDIPYTDESKKELLKLRQKDFPVLDETVGENMKQIILNASQSGDSVGGIIECFVFGLPAGIGEPLFDRMESRISSAIFSIPAIRGIEFGNGFSCAELYGSQNNDAFCVDAAGNVKTQTNHAGGILGGISNGMPVVFRVAVKPTPSIAKPQNSVDLTTKSETVLEIKGRHDPCIVQRAVPVIEAATAISLLDLLLDYKKFLS